MVSNDKSIFSDRANQALAELLAITNRSQREKFAAYLLALAEKHKEEVVSSSEPIRAIERVNLLRLTARQIPLK